MKPSCGIGRQAVLRFAAEGARDIAFGASPRSAGEARAAVAVSLRSAGA